MLHNKATFGSRNASEGRFFCIVCSINLKLANLKLFME